MEKKFKFNFILKGIAIFAFVVFCLLAILAGVTLPFVSNASTVDCAIASVESDYAIASSNIVPVDYESFTTTLSNCNTTDTYYGFYITEDLYNYVKTFTFDSSESYIFAQLSNATILMCGTASFNDFGTVKNFNYCCLSPDFQYFNSLFTTIESYSHYCNYFLIKDGFTFTMLNSELPGSSYVIRDKIKVFTSLPYKETVTTVYKTNYGFESRFGYIGSFVTSNLYVSLQNNALIPDSLCRIRDSETNEFVNGWSITDNNELFLPILDSFDEFGNSVSAPFTGWHLTNISVNGVSSSRYNVYFEVLGQRISRVGVATITNNVVDIEAGATPDFYVESNITNTENLLVYGIQNLPLKYNLKVNLSYNDFYKFFAFFDYRTYTITNNDFYLSGVTTASKGYYDTGYNKGYSVGKDEGYKTGFSAGDAQGYNRGVESANTYSFLGLFGAIFDAPIKAIFGGTSILPAGTTITDSNGNTITLQSTTTVNRAGLLNFNLMGVNLSGFVLALFSLSILVVVIKFALAKR